MADVEKKEQFATLVFPAELAEIARRRERLGLPPVPAGDQPSSELGLVGLAFSGGGIRSASFCLGVVQHLAHTSALRFVDYLSTVSGGGYVGSCVSSLLGDPDPAADPRNAPFPLRKEFGEDEPPALVHLRNGSNYLSPPGSLSKLRVPAIVLRGVVLSLLSVLPYVLLAVFLTHVLYTRILPPIEDRGYDLEILRTSYPFSVGVLLFVLVSAAYPFVSGFVGKLFVWERRDTYERVIAATLFTALVALLAWPFTSLVNYAVVNDPADAAEKVRGWVHSFWIPTVGLSAALAAVAARSPAVAGVLRSIGIAMAAALGLMLPFGTYLAVCLWEIPAESDLPDVSVATDTRGAISAALEKGTVPDALCAEITTRHGKHDATLQASMPAESVAPVGTTGKRWKVTLGAGAYEVRSTGKRVIVHRLGTEHDRDGVGVFVACVALLLLNWRFLDVNLTSPHGFFRDRLSRVFLVRTRSKEGQVAVLPNDDLKLSHLNEKPNGVAPYHILNAALNLGGSTDPQLRGRNADFFMFSKCYVGSERTGYAKTADMEAADDHLNLGTAMAISAAAASPQMGAMASTRDFSALLTLANVRMSYWLPNPGRIGQSWVRTRAHIGAGPKYLLHEALGTPDERRRLVNVSDGGHVENLGLYQLLRRRCKVIIAVDGEADGGLHFGGLVTLMRYACIDMGIAIDIDLDALRRRDDGTSAEQWAIGTIRYTENEEGRLVYIKACVHGNEGEVLRDYRRTRPEFPHESTADQFFTEAQLEAYRSLGAHIAGQVWSSTVTSATELLAAAEQRSVEMRSDQPTRVPASLPPHDGAPPRVADLVPRGVSIRA